MAHDDMNHLSHLPAIADSDVAVLRRKEETYQGSWKRAGGRSAWFMARRNMDRLITMMAPVEFKLAPSRIPLRPGDTITMDDKEFGQLMASMRAEDIFSKIAEHSDGADGTVLACLRDLRRYFILVEAEMVAEGIVEPEGSPAVVEPDRAEPEDSAQISTLIWQYLLSESSPDIGDITKGPVRSEAHGGCYLVKVNLLAERILANDPKSSRGSIEHVLTTLGGTTTFINIAGNGHRVYQIPAPVALAQAGTGITASPPDPTQIDYSSIESRLLSHLYSPEEKLAEIDTSNEERARYGLFISDVLPGLTQAQLDAMVDSAIAAKSGDFYSTIAAATGVERPTVKRRCFARMYGTGRAGQKLSTRPSDADPAETLRVYREYAAQRFDAAGSPLDGRVPNKYEDRVFEWISHACWPHDSSLSGEMAEKAKAIAPGGGVYARMVEAMGDHQTEASLKASVLRQVYSSPELRRDGPVPTELHEKVARAVSYAVNCEGIDSALDTPDHILAELLTFRIIAHLEGRSGGQLIDAGWTFGPHGVPIAPSGDIHREGSRHSALLDYGLSLTPRAELETLRANLIGYNNQYCEPPLARDEVERITRDVFIAKGGIIPAESQTGTATQPIPDVWCLNAEWLVEYIRRRCARHCSTSVLVQLASDPDGRRELSCSSTEAGVIDIILADTSAGVTEVRIGDLGRMVMSWLPPTDSTILSWSDEPRVPGTPADGGHHRSESEAVGETAPAAGLDQSGQDFSPQVPRPGPAVSHDIDEFLGRIDSAHDLGYTAHCRVQVSDLAGEHDVIVSRQPSGEYRLFCPSARGEPFGHDSNRAALKAVISAWYPQSFSAGTSRLG